MSEQVIEDYVIYNVESNDHHAPEEEVGTICKILLNYLTSAEEQIELNDGAEAVRNLNLSDRLRNASIRPRSAALENAHQAGEVYIDSLATTTAWYTS